MFFVVLGKWREKMSKATVDQSNKLLGKMTEEGFKFLAQYWTLGRYDVVSIVEAKDEKALMKTLMRWSHMLQTETLTAIPRQEAINLVE